MGTRTEFLQIEAYREELQDLAIRLSGAMHTMDLENIAVHSMRMQDLVAHIRAAVAMASTWRRIKGNEDSAG